MARILLFLPCRIFVTLMRKPTVHFLPSNLHSASSLPRHRGVMRALYTLIILLQLGLCCPVPGASMRPDQASAAVRGWLRTDRAPVGESLSASVARVDSYADGNGKTLYHVVSLRPAGFVVLAADDLVEPVIAFSKQGQFDPSTNAPLTALLMRDLRGRTSNADQQGPTPKAARLQLRTKWQKLLSASTNIAPASSSSTVSDVRITPFLQSKWSQSTVSGLACYNYYTPPYSSGNANNYVCGCVATAMAQLMRFYQFPNTSVGTATFSFTVNGVSKSGQLLGGDSLGGPYVWANMPNMPFVPSNPITAQQQAIGALTHDAAIAVHMDFASDGSSAYLSAAKSSLMNVFHYSNGIDGQNSGSTIGSGLIGMINPNLDARFPVILGIDGTPGGHAVVCDGYGYSASTLYHHLNLGWAGTDDAWYALPTIDTVLGTFSIVDECLYNVFTSGTGEIISGRVLDSSGLPVANATVTTTRKGYTYTSSTDSKGIYALVNLPSRSSAAVSVTKAGYAATLINFATGTSTDYNKTSGNIWGADFTITPAPPSNDQCSAATFLATLNSTNSQTTLNATSTGDPIPTAQTNFGAGVWYEFTPATDGQLLVDTIGSGFDTVLGLYTGSCGAMTELASDDNSAGNLNASITNIVHAGTNYYILAGGKGGATGNLVLHTRLNGPASLLLQANPLNGGTVSGQGSFIPGTQQQISATANQGWVFSRWQDGVTQSLRTITVPVAGTNCTAYFTEIPILQPTIWSSNGPTFSITGTVGKTNRIDFSTNLTQWTTLAVVTNITGTVNYTDTSTSNAPKRFYRVVTSP